MPASGTANQDTRQIAIISHPKPAYRRLAEQALDELQSSSLAPYVRPTVYPSHQTVGENIDLLHGIVTAGTRLGVVGGDGMWRTLMKTTLALAESSDSADREVAAHIAATSVDGGNGRDIGRAQHGRTRMHAAPSWIFSHSHDVQAWAIDYKATIPGKMDDETIIIADRAMSYMGFGETAVRAGDLVDDTYVNGRRFIRDIRLGWSALQSDSSFKISDTEGVRIIRDKSVFMGHCIAKVCTVPTEHWERQLFITETRATKLANYRAAVGGLTGLQAGEYSEEPYSFTPLNDIQMYVDGDPPIELAAGYEVTVKPTDNSYTMLVSRQIPEVYTPRTALMAGLPFLRW